MSIVVPPGGFAGLAQMTPASKAAWRGSAPRRTSRRRKRKAARSGTSRKAKRSGGRGRLPKFGSKAWRKKFKLDKR
jgi:hypothetical protein